MHELSIILSILDEVGEESVTRGLHDVEAVHLKLGVFSGVDRDALLFAWELAREGTALEHARLEIQTIPLLIHCAACDRDQAPPSNYQLVCPLCDSPAENIVTGRELEVVALEVAE
jgi:hydrogenase nickel incorporation protein HypA/HybF